MSSNIVNLNFQSNKISFDVKSLTVTDGIASALLTNRKTAYRSSIFCIYDTQNFVKAVN